MYLHDLQTRLSDRLAGLPAEMRSRHARYVAGTQNEDGGFPGREGGSDLYYTAFALRSLLVLDALTLEICQRASAYIKQAMTQQASVVDFFSLLYAALLVQAGSGIDVFAESPADWPDRVAATLATFRTADGGYAKAPGSASGSTYHTFLVGLAFQLLGRSWPDEDAVHRFVLTRLREDGGFVEIAPMRRSGTNPTAAGIGILQLLNRLDQATSDRVTGFLAEMPSMEGGLRANTRVPLADLLSTFTGLWTLDQLGTLDRIDQPAAHEYAQSLEMPEGGFRGGLWDEGYDVEYTFYGLGVVGLVGNSD